MSHPEGYTLAEAEDTLPGTRAGGRARLLLVEDDKALRRFLEIALQRAGYEVLLAADGLDAMKLALSTRIDLVVTDAMMPALSGQELCRFFRNSPRLSQIPLVLLSALERKEVSTEEKLANAYLAKPVSTTELTQCVAGLLAAIKK